MFSTAFLAQVNLTNENVFKNKIQQQQKKKRREQQVQRSLNFFFEFQIKIHCSVTEFIFSLSLEQCRLFWHEFLIHSLATVWSTHRFELSYTVAGRFQPYTLVYLNIAFSRVRSLLHIQILYYKIISYHFGWRPIQRELSHFWIS